MPFPLIVPPLEPKSSPLGTEKFQEGNYFWNSYVLLYQPDTNNIDDSPVYASTRIRLSGKDEQSVIDATVAKFATVQSEGSKAV